MSLFAVLGSAAAGCGSTKEAASTTYQRNVVPAEARGTVTVSGKSTILMNFKAGTRVACKGWPGMQVTVPATGASVIARSQGTRELRLRRLQDGTIHVSCPPTS